MYTFHIYLHHADLGQFKAINDKGSFGKNPTFFFCEEEILRPSKNTIYTNKEVKQQNDEGEILEFLKMQVPVTDHQIDQSQTTHTT